MRTRAHATAAFLVTAGLLAIVPALSHAAPGHGVQHQATVTSNDTTPTSPPTPTDPTTTPVSRERRFPGCPTCFER